MHSTRIPQPPILLYLTSQPRLPPGLSPAQQVQPVKCQLADQSQCSQTRALLMAGVTPAASPPLREQMMSPFIWTCPFLEMFKERETVTHPPPHLLPRCDGSQLVQQIVRRNPRQLREVCHLQWQIVCQRTSPIRLSTEEEKTEEAKRLNTPGRVDSFPALVSAANHLRWTRNHGQNSQKISQQRANLPLWQFLLTHRHPFQTDRNLNKLELELLAKLLCSNTKIRSLIKYVTVSCMLNLHWNYACVLNSIKFDTIYYLSFIKAYLRVVYWLIYHYVTVYMWCDLPVLPRRLPDGTTFTCELPGAYMHIYTRFASCYVYIFSSARAVSTFVAGERTWPKLLADRVVDRVNGRSVASIAVRVVAQAEWVAVIVVTIVVYV